MSSLVDQALRLNARYVEEVVIGWGLCPWAAQAWREGAVARHVLVEPALEPTGVLSFIDAIADRPEISIGLVLFPRVTASAAAWGTFAEKVRRVDRARRAPSAQTPFLLAAFHPLTEVAAPDVDAGALVPYLRRTPDPMLQLVRASLLDTLSRGGRDVSGEIAQANFTTVRIRTPAALDATIQDIRRDRDASYARL